MRAYNSIDDDCETVPTTIDIRVADGKDKPIVRLEITMQGSPSIQFDIRNWNTGLKLISMITLAMNDTLPAQD